MRFVHINIHFRKSVVQIYEAKKVSGSVQVFRLILPSVPPSPSGGCG